MLDCSDLVWILEPDSEFESWFSPLITQCMTLASYSRLHFLYQLCGDNNGSSLIEWIWEVIVILTDKDLEHYVTW